MKKFFLLVAALACALPAAAQEFNPFDFISSYGPSPTVLILEGILVIGVVIGYMVIMFNQQQATKRIADMLERHFTGKCPACERRKSTYEPTVAGEPDVPDDAEPVSWFRG